MQKYPEAVEKPELVLIKKKKKQGLEIIQLAVVCMQIKQCVLGVCADG